MKTQDRLRAFELRNRGMTWEEIGEKLNYDATTVSKDVKRVVSGTPRAIPLSAPLADYVASHCAGDLDILARRLKVSPQWLRKILKGKAKPSQALRRQMTALTGLTEGEIFHG